LPLTGGDPTKGLGDPEIFALLEDARTRLLQFATIAWIDHSPLFVGERKNYLLALAEREARSNQSLSATSLATPATAAAPERASAPTQKRAHDITPAHPPAVGQIEAQRDPSAAPPTTPSIAGVQARNPSLPRLDIAGVRLSRRHLHALLTHLSFRSLLRRSHPLGHRLLIHPQ
jgi:hypothetical protein